MASTDASLDLESAVDMATNEEMTITGTSPDLQPAEEREAAIAELRKQLRELRSQDRYFCKDCMPKSEGGMEDLAWILPVVERSANGSLGLREGVDAWLVPELDDYGQQERKSLEPLVLPPAVIEPTVGMGVWERVLEGGNWVYQPPERVSVPEEGTEAAVWARGILEQLDGEEMPAAKVAFETDRVDQPPEALSLPSDASEAAGSTPGSLKQPVAPEMAGRKRDKVKAAGRKVSRAVGRHLSGLACAGGSRGSSPLRLTRVKPVYVASHSYRANGLSEN